MLVISRPEISIRLGFRAISGSGHKDFMLYEISAAVIRYDITIDDFEKGFGSGSSEGRDQ